MLPRPVRPRPTPAPFQRSSLPCPAPQWYWAHSVHNGRYGQSLPTKSKPPHQYQPHRALLRMRRMQSTERWPEMPLLHYRASPGILTLDTLAGQESVLGIHIRLRSTPHPAQSSLATEKPASLRVLTTALIRWLPEELPPSPWGPGGQGQQHAELRSREPLRPSGQR